MSFLVNPYWYSSAGCADADALAFLTAAGITDATITSAICTLVTSMKANGTWAKCNAIYPFVGGTSFTTKFNLKDPRDLNAAYRLSFGGGWVYSANGILGNGVNTYAETFFNPSSVWSLHNNHLSIYSRTSTATGVDFDLGLGGIAGEQAQSLIVRRTGNTSSYDALTAAGTGRITFTNTDGRGFYNGSITASNSRKYFKNGVLQVSNLTSITQSLPNYNIYLGAYNQVGLPQYYGAKQYAFASIGAGLTDAEAATLYTDVQAFNTTLGRQV
jgi:hypothetical protein